MPTESFLSLDSTVYFYNGTGRWADKQTRMDTTCLQIQTIGFHVAIELFQVALDLAGPRSSIG